MGFADSNTLNIARHYLDVNRQEDALRALERATSEEVETPQFWLIKSEALFELGRSDQSQEVARRGLEIDPENVGLLDVLALSELARGFYGKADKALVKALQLSPENPILLAYRALALAHHGENEEAWSEIGHAMRLAPEWKPVLQARAQVAILTKDKRAQEYVDDLLRSDPDDRLAHALQGNLAAEQKRFGSASRAFSEAARLDPGDRELVEVAREARVHAHPVLAPARLLWWFGRWRSYFLYLTVITVLAASGLESLRIVIICIWLVMVVLTWLGPPVLRRYEKRKYGGF